MNKAQVRRLEKKVGTGHVNTLLPDTLNVVHRMRRGEDVTEELKALEARREAGEHSVFLDILSKCYEERCKRTNKK